MSTVYSAVEKLRALITENHVEPKVEEVVKEVISLLTDPTVLILEWNEIDVQTVAREIIAAQGNLDITDIIVNPLPKDAIEFVIGMLDKYYDCNYGITWESVRSTLSDIVLPKAEDCLIEKEEVCKWTREIGLEGVYETDCRNTYDFCGRVDRFTYCPYCGKEVVDVGAKENE